MREDGGTSVGARRTWDYTPGRKKRGWRWLIILTVILIFLVIAHGLILNRSVRHRMEEGGTALTGEPVGIGDLSTSLLGGKVVLRLLHVGAPSGADTALTAARIELRVPVFSLFSDSVTIKQIVVNGLQLNAATGGGNLGRLLERMRTNAAAAAGATHKLVTVHAIEFRNVGVVLNGTVTAVPDFTLTDLGEAHSADAVMLYAGVGLLRAAATAVRAAGIAGVDAEAVAAGWESAAQEALMPPPAENPPGTARFERVPTAGEGSGDALEKAGEKARQGVRAIPIYF